MRSPRLTRREVLAGAGALAAASACGPAGPPTIDPQRYDGAVRTAFGPESIPEDLARFTLGVQSGAARPDRILLWTYASSAAPLALRVWRDVPGTQSEVMLVEDVAATPTSGGYVKVAVDTLAPATWYRFAFFTPDFSVRSRVGRFRTAYPDDWSEPLTVAATSCTKTSWAPYKALSLQASLEHDLFLHLGDQSYNDPAFQLEEYRDKWKATRADVGYRDAFAAASMLAVWDDHEIINDFDGESVNPVQLANAKDAFFEMNASEEDLDRRLWRSYRWGRTAEFFQLDCRSERKPSTRETAAAEYVSAAQLEWLLGALEASPAKFKVLLNSVPITWMPAPLWGNQADRWQGYVAQRDALLDAILDRNLGPVVFLSGDFHVGFVAHVESEGRRRGLWDIACGPGGQGNNPLGLLTEPGADPANRELAWPAAQFEYATGAVGTTLVTFDPKKETLRVRFLDPSTGAARFDRELPARGA